MLLLALSLSLARAAEWPGPADPAPWTRTESGLEIQDLAVGSGEEVENGATVEVDYTGMLADGTVFDSSVDRDQTFSFRVGQHQVILGWEEGLLGMRVGGRRRLVIPAELGYGDRAVGPIPASSVLYFEVQLHALVPPRRAPTEPTPLPPAAFRDLPDGVAWADVTPGNGRRVRRGRVCLDYASWHDGAPVEDTYGRAACTWYRLDDDDLPPLLEAGLSKMREGCVRQIRGRDGTVYEVALQATGK